MAFNGRGGEILTTSWTVDEAPPRDALALLRTASGDRQRWGVRAAEPEGPQHPAGRGHNRRRGPYLPAPVSSFIGREDDIAAITDAVTRSRLVTVCGPGGIGKTRLALELARRRTRHDPDGAWLVELAPAIDRDEVWMVELASVSDAGQVPHAVASAVRAGGGGEQGQATLDLVRHLRQRRALLILDNCEHVVAGCARLVTELLRSCPRLGVLTTSREPLGITGERVWWLKPLAVPRPSDVDRTTVAPAEAVQLFVERAGDTRPGFALSADVASAVGEICRRLDGLPLAIELAATWTSVLSPAEILARLDDRFHLLTGAGTPGEARHGSLRGAFEWSHVLLSPDQAALLRRLSVFAGGWSLGAAEDVCGGDGVGSEQVLDLLGALVGKSLVVVDHGGAVTRYRMLETIRSSARTKLDEAGETDRLLSRHASWCVARAEEADTAREGSAHEAWLRRIDEDHDNFCAALAWARQRGKVETRLRLATSLAWFWETRGHLRQGLDWLDAESTTSDDAPAALRAEAMRVAGRFIHMLGDHGSGLALIDRSVSLFRQTGDVEEASGCVCHDVLEMCRNPRHALPVMEQQVAKFREVDDNNRLAHALCNLGQTRFFRGDAAGARRCFAEVLGLRLTGIEVDAADDALFGLARVALLRGDYDAVEAPLREVLEHAERRGDDDGRSAALSLLGDLARARGQTSRARALLGDALELAHEAGLPLSIGRCELFLGAVEFADGALESAGDLCARALSRAEGASFPYHEVRCTLGSADVAAAVGDGASAARLYADAHERARASGDDQGMARALAGQADLARASGDLDTAMRRHHRALELEEDIGDLPAITRSLEGLGALAGLAGGPEKAARLFSAAFQLRERHGFARPAPHQRRYDADVELLRKGLGEEAWRLAWEQGALLSLEMAASYARKGRGGRRRPSSGLESITPAERDVVTLAVQGLTNAEVGERLFISPRTVQHHLGHVYAKLGVRSRRELAHETAGWVASGAAVSHA